MHRASRISGGQLVALLLASRLSNCLLLTPNSLDGVTLTDSVLATLLSGILLFLLFLPTLLALRRFRGRGLIDVAYLHGRPMGRVVCIAYVLLCLFILCLDIVQFYDFAEKSMKAGFSVTALTVAIVAVAFAAAFYGIQALGRTALLVAAFSAVCLIVFSTALVPEMRLLHFSPTVGSGFPAILRRAVAELPRTAEVVAIGMLYPYIGGSRTGVAAVFSGLTVLFTALVSVTAMGVLGDFSSQVTYPYYTAVTAVQLGVFQRMDILIITVWLSTFFVRMTLFCTLFLSVCSRVLGRRSRVPAAVIATLLLAGFTLLVSGGMPVGGWPWVTAVYWWVLGAFCLILPPVLRLMIKNKRRGAV